MGASGHCVVLKLMWRVNGPQRMLPFFLMMQVVDCLLQDVSSLVCQMLGSRFRVVPDRMILVMAHLN